ncbi:MAG: hypothetical protein JRG93_19995 [Deltaproteobacteria bacterium]|nr:hypothetical protein [Deltaproteobacteria bacterium]MBW2402586.1 hypothetical protein [Deltaproteobacteria bacterium]MBW2547738.1 hypothetical protein [Deltaproteobacteria bacterium]
MPRTKKQSSEAAVLDGIRGEVVYEGPAADQVPGLTHELAKIRTTSSKTSVPASSNPMLGGRWEMEQRLCHNALSCGTIAP